MEGGGHFVKLECFEGPLHLLLHLIRASQLNVFEIDLLALTTQYLNRLRLLRFRDLTDAAAFMEMASCLIEIKSSHLLPRDESEASLDGEEGEEDAADKLRRRLIEFEAFRRAGEELGRSARVAALTMAPHEGKRLAEVHADVNAPLRGDSATLLVLYEQMLCQLADRRTERVTAMQEGLTLEEVIAALRVHLDKRVLLRFEDLYASLPSRYELVAYTLAILQMAREGKLKVHQEEVFGPLWIHEKEWEPDELVERIAGAEAECQQTV